MCVYIYISKLLTFYICIILLNFLVSSFYVFHKSLFMLLVRWLSMILLSSLSSFIYSLTVFLWRLYFFQFIWLVYNFCLLCICVLKFTVFLSPCSSLYSQISPPSSPPPLVFISSECDEGFFIDWQRRSQLAVWRVIS